MNGLLTFFAFTCCVITAAGECTQSKYKLGPKDWLQCYESNIREVKSKLQGNLAKISVVQSSIVEIRDLASERNGALGVEILYFHNCGIQRLGSNAFRGLNTLKELSLAHNDIERLNVSWFYDLPSLEILDLSFNKISSLDPLVYMQLTKVQRFEINNNLLNCISTENIQAMRRLKDIRIQENPISHICRAKLTLWLRNHNVNYALKEDNFKWFDDILWECYSGVENKGLISSEANLKMNTCVVTNMLNQLSTVLGFSPSMQTSISECYQERVNLQSCFSLQGATTNGKAIMNLVALTEKQANFGRPRKADHRPAECSNGMCEI